jgi:hypothetical protein
VQKGRFSQHMLNFVLVLLKQMSLSTLESLPNEILSDIIQKYINGVDVLVGFSYQLNQRFNALIVQCPRLHFNFIHCRKDDFCFCMGLLPAYIDKVEELAISELNTPGQVHAFFSLFPSFAPFKRLRKLNIHLNGKSIDRDLVEEAFDSLSDTTIDTLSINTINSAQIHPLNHILIDIFKIKTLKRLSLKCDLKDFDWELLSNVSLNIEYLTIFGLTCEFQHLKIICQCAPHLKYLNIRFIDRSNHNYGYLAERSEKNIKLMPALHTLILSFAQSSSTTFDMLAQCLRCMPALNRLEIKAYNELLDGEAWETLLKASLPLLAYFSLWTTVSNKAEDTLNDLLASFQTLFWIEKKNFNIMITKHALPILTRALSDNSIDFTQYKFALPATVWWMAPERSVRNNFSTLDETTSLNLSLLPDYIWRPYYFNKVKCLTVTRPDEHLLTWLTTYVNCSQIRELIVSFSSKDTNVLTLILSCVSNINSLQISFDQLILHKNATVRKNHFLKRLDISVHMHTFTEEDIIIIAELFPFLEHIKINTQNLYNVPILRTHLPHLRSLTFTIIDFYLDNDDDYEERMWDYDFRISTQFFFRRERNWVTIWVDQAALEEPYWGTFDKTPPRSNISSIITTTSNNPETTTTDSDSQKKKKRKFSFFQCFK